MRTQSIPYRIVSLTVCISILFSLIPAGAMSGVSPAHTAAAVPFQPSNAEPGALT